MKNRKNTEDGDDNSEKEEYLDAIENSVSSNQDNIDSQSELYECKNAIPWYFNLLDNYDILQYKDIQIPRLSTINQLNLNKYKKPFNEYFKKITLDNILMSNFISLFSKITENELKIKKKSEKVKENKNIKVESANKSIDDNMKVVGKNKAVKKSYKAKRIFISKVFDNNMTLVHKKRGRVPKKKNPRHRHSALDDDNILRKIQVHFFTFLVSFTNDYINSIYFNNNNVKNKFHFKQIDYNIKKTINHQSIEKMKSSNIGEILQNKASPKNKLCEDNVNQIIYEKLCKHFPDIKENYFNKLFKEFFIEYYYNKNDNPIIINGIKVNLSDKTNSFNKLLKKNINYSIKFRKVAAYFYLDIKKEDIKLNIDIFGGKRKPFFIVE